MNRLLKFAVGITLFWLSVLSMAADLAGRVIMVRGDASAINSAGEKRTLQRRDEIFATDTITTGERSRVQIRFVDKGMLALRENSTLNIKTYRQPNQADDEGEVLMELVEGGFRTLTGSIGKGDKAAYKVDTPVASIGIRGTLYSVLLNKTGLVAGVWNGGISLNTPQGSFNLGFGADFDFAQLDNQGFQGLLTPPEALSPPANQPQEQQDNDNEQAPELDTTAEQAPDAQRSGSDPSVQQPNLPNALDREESSGDEQQLNQQVVNTDGRSGSGSNDPSNPGNGNPGSGNPDDLISPDARMSNGEYTNFLKSEEYGAFVTDQGATVGAALVDDNGNTVFVSLQPDAPEDLHVTRFSGPDTGVEQPIANVSWGIWNGSSEQTIEQYGDINSLDHNDIAGQAVWIRSTPVRSSDLNQLSGTINFSGDSAAPGFDSRGEALTNVSGSFNLNLTTGAINGGTLTADYNGDVWNANFIGDIRPGSASQNTPILDLDITSGSHGELGLNTSTSTIDGILTAPASSGGVPGVAGGFQLEDSAANSANGLIAWPGSQP